MHTQISESEEDSLITMLNSNNEDDINLALSIVNKMESNRILLIKLITNDYDDDWNNRSSCKWYKSLYGGKATYYRKDHKGGSLIFNRRHDE